MSEMSEEFFRMSGVPSKPVISDEGQVSVKSVTTRKMVLVQHSDAADGPMGEREPVVQQITTGKSEISTSVDQRSWDQEIFGHAPSASQPSEKSMPQLQHPWTRQGQHPEDHKNQHPGTQKLKMNSGDNSAMLRYV
ncbi:UNVERIFIED_CONTAM: hypothetical protein PYX00_008136 [Menopon gallinae]|uniref:Uncharacterized protein n=1 Tax=Menopon gallinae TaxID=328185 RepID=A0AAW2HLW1_9NEOP